MKKRKVEEEDHEAWLSSYAGFVTLLFAFFTVMYGMGSSNGNKMVKANKSMTDAFHAIDTAPIFPLIFLAEDQGSVYQGSYSLRDRIQLIQDERGSVVSIVSELAFEPGRADLLSQMVPDLVKIGKSILTSPFSIRVEGHTDDLPIRSGLYRSNWELSVARATSVLNFFIEQGVHPRRLSTSGFAHWRPVASNMTESGRAKNRRVEIVFLQAGEEDLL